MLVPHLKEAIVMPFEWAAVAAVVCVVVLPLLAAGAVIGRAAERRRLRRGGLLELDRPGARRALEQQRRATRRWHAGGVAICGHTVRPDMDVVTEDGYIFCSPRCADERRLIADDWFDVDAFTARSRALGFEPFAGGGDQAA